MRLHSDTVGGHLQRLEEELTLAYAQPGLVGSASALVAAQYRTTIVRSLRC